MALRNNWGTDKAPSLTLWLEDSLLATPFRGRLTLKAPTGLAYGFSDDRGTEKGNQDRLAIAYCLDPYQSGGAWFFAGVCDGVGGELNGEVAASITMAEIVSELCAGDFESPDQRLSAAVFRAHSAVRERLRGSATTFAGLLVDEHGRSAIASVGDSRIYTISAKGTTQLTQDHTLEEMLRGQIQKKNAAQVNRVLNDLTLRWKESLGQAIGGEMPLKPQVQTIPSLGVGIGAVLCTDGVWKVVEPIFEHTVLASGDMTDLARRLLNLTDVLRATDNATAIVLPDFSQLVAWLGADHKASETGLVHLITPNESVVAPWQLFSAERAISPSVRASYLTHINAPQRSASKTKSKRKPKEEADDRSLKKSTNIQLTIEEEPNRDQYNQFGQIHKK